MIPLVVLIAGTAIIFVERGHVRRRRLTWVLDRLAEAARRRLPLGGTLQAMSVDAPKRLRMPLLQIGVGLDEGRRLGEAMAGHPKLFPAYVARSVAAAEAAGRLEPLLERLPAAVRGRSERQQQAALLLLYPLFLLLLPPTFGSPLFGFIGPRLYRVWAQLGMDDASYLPAFFIIPPAALAVAVFVALLIAGILWRDSALLRRLPAARAKREETLMLFSHLAAVLLRSGMPAHQAWRVAGEATALPWMERRAGAVADALENGRPLESAIEGLPATMREILVAGERAGKAAEAFEDAARWLGGRVEGHGGGIHRAAVLLVLLAGAMIGAIYLEVMYLPWEITGHTHP